MTKRSYDRIREAFLLEVFGLEELEQQFILSEEQAFLEPPAAGAEPAPSPVLAASMPAPAPERARLEALLQTAKEALSLGAYLRELAHRCDRVTYRAVVFEQAQISRDYWSRLLNDEVKPSKEKLLRVAILLKLSVQEAEELLDKAGYSLSPTILRDVVVEFCLRQGHYDFVDIERLLADHEIQSLFNDRVVKR